MAFSRWFPIIPCKCKNVRRGPKVGPKAAKASLRLPSEWNKRAKGDIVSHYWLLAPFGSLYHNLEREHPWVWLVFFFFSQWERKERKWESYFHESRTRNETRSGARIWATNQRENYYSYSALDLHALNFENIKRKKKTYRFLVLRRFIYKDSDLICLSDKQLGLRKIRNLSDTLSLYSSISFFFFLWLKSWLSSWVCSSICDVVGTKILAWILQNFLAFAPRF